MNKAITTVISACLLAMSGNAAAITINDHVYGISGYTLDDIDQAIEAFREDVSTKRERKRLKKARKLDRKVEKLGNKLELAATTGDGGKLNKKRKKLGKKERKLLAILAGYLPETGDTLLDTGGSITGSNLILDGITPPDPDTFLPEPGDILATVTGGSAGNNPPGTDATDGPAPEVASVPEPSMLALLCLGLPVLLLQGHRRKRQPVLPA